MTNRLHVQGVVEVIARDGRATMYFIIQGVGKLVQVFLGAPLLVDVANLGSASQRVQLFLTTFMDPATLQESLPKPLPPSPPLDKILTACHIPMKPGRSDRLPFAPHNQLR